MLRMFLPGFAVMVLGCYPATLSAQTQSPEERAQICILNEDSQEYASSSCQWFRDGAIYARDLMARSESARFGQSQQPGSTGTLGQQFRDGQGNMILRQTPLGEEGLPVTQEVQ